MRILQILFICLVFCITQACSEPILPESKKIASKEQHLDLDKLKTGDIVVKKGKGRLSHLIATKLSEKIPFSHCGFVFRQGDSLLIVHSVAKELTGTDGVQSVRMQEFLTDYMPGSLYFVRIKDSTTQKNIPELAANYLKKKIPFDYSISSGDSTRVNCLEFVYHVCKRAGNPNCFKTITVQNNKVLAFNSLVDSLNFMTLYHY